MADYTIYDISLGDTGAEYGPKYDAFVLASKAVAEEVEYARDGAGSLLLNLQTYANYTLGANIVGGGTWKCTDMPDGNPNSQDYCTVKQALNLVGSSGSVPTSITDLVPGGTLSDNDILVVADDGFSIVGRPTTYTKLTVPTTAVVANGNYDMNLNGTSRTANLPTGNEGMVISFADIAGLAGQNNPTTNPKTYNLTINPTGVQNIMNQANGVSLIVDDYPFCSFDLVYIDGTFGWTLARFQR